MKTLLLPQVGEVCASGISFINSNYNGVLVHGNGRIIMVLGVIVMSAFVFLRNLRQLEIAGDFGFIVVLIMVIVIMVRPLCEENLVAYTSNAFYSLLGISTVPS